MKRITTNDDIRFPISVVKGLNSDVFTIQFYTTSKAVCLTKTNADVEDGIIYLEWNELYPLGTGVMNYTVLIPEADGSFSDDTFNRSISGTTIFYIVSNIIVPDGDDAQDLIDIVSQLDTKLDAEISRSTGKDNSHDTALADVYTKAETNTLLAGKANKNGNNNEDFAAHSFFLRREGAATTLYNYSTNNNNYVSFYDQSNGQLTYQFVPNQADNIATERQLATKANSSDVYTKSEVENLIDEHVPDLPDNVVTDANYVHTDNNYTTAEKNKLSGIASGAEVNVQSDWNVNLSSSDAYIKNKPTIPTVDISITGSSQANPVRGGAIYNALNTKVDIVEYPDLDELYKDSPVNGTIGYDGDNEDFYIYNSPSGEWIKITTSVLSTIISGSPNPVSSAAIYTALAGKAEYRWYGTYNNMIADSPANGTIGYESTNEYFYIYDLANLEWKRIDGGGSLPDNVVIDANYVHTDNNFTNAYKSTLDTLPDSITTKELTATDKVNTKEMVFTPYYNEAPENNKIGLNVAFDKNNERSVLEFYDYYSQASLFLPIIDGAEFVTTSGFPVKEVNAGGSGTTQSSSLIPCTYNLLQVRNTRVRTINYEFTQGNTSYILLIDRSYLSGFPAVTTLNFENITITWQGGNAFDLATFRSGTDSYALINLLKVSDTVILGDYKIY